MAGPEHETRRGPEAGPKTLPPSRSPFTGIVAVIMAIVLAVVAIAFIAGAFSSEDVGEDLDNAALEGPVAEGAAEEEAAAPDQEEAQ